MRAWLKAKLPHQHHQRTTPFLCTRGNVRCQCHSRVSNFQVIYVSNTTYNKAVTYSIRYLALETSLLETSAGFESIFLPHIGNWLAPGCVAQGALETEAAPQRAGAEIFFLRYVLIRASNTVLYQREPKYKIRLRNTNQIGNSTQTVDPRLL